MNRPVKRITKNSMVRIKRDELTPGRLFQLFGDGALAVILENDDRVLPLWNDLMSSGKDSGLDSGEVLPWEGNLMDIARNYQSKGGPGDDLGDVMFFIKDRLAYIARKFNIFENPETKILDTDPRSFSNGERPFSIPEDIRSTIWEVGSDVFKSALPVETKPFPYSMSVERLKYNDSPAEFDKLVLLLNNSSDRWAQFGRKMDNHVINAAGPFTYSYVNVLYALLCETPVTRQLVQRLNQFFKRKNKMTQVEGNADLIGRAHTDGRLITCISSVRNSIKTEVFDGSDWVDLPLTGDSLAIFPGRGLEKYGIKPTWHRILHLRNADAKPGQRKTNETFILGLRSIDRVQS